MLHAKNRAPSLRTHRLKAHWQQLHSRRRHARPVVSVAGIPHIDSRADLWVNGGWVRQHKVTGQWVLLKAVFVKGEHRGICSSRASETAEEEKINTIETVPEKNVDAGVEGFVRACQPPPMS